MPSNIVKPLQWYDYNRTDPLADGLVGLWPFWEGAGGRVQDVVGKNNGVINGATWATGPDGHIIDCVKASSQEVLALGAPSIASNGVGTMMVWFRSTQAVANNAICAEADSTSSNPAFWFNTDSGVGGSLRLFQRGTASSPSATDFVGSGGVATNGEWHFAAVTLDGTNFRIYFDGELEVGPKTIPAADFSTMDNFAVGSLHRSSVIYGTCQVSQAMTTFRVYNASEIKDLFNSRYRLITPASQSVVVAPAAAGGVSKIIGGGILSC